VASETASKTASELGLKNSGPGDDGLDFGMSVDVVDGGLHVDSVVDSGQLVVDE